MIVRLFEPADAEGLATVLEQMQAHYDVPCPPREEIIAGLGDIPPGNAVLLAQDVQGPIVGFAAVAAIYPGPGLRKGLFLKELFVDADRRGEGIGRALMGAVARFAIERGYGRIDWTADRTKPRLAAFYSALGAVAQDEKRFYRLAGEALASLVSSASARLR
jgi:GNAT superfamily N-acetyltransferase